MSKQNFGRSSCVRYSRTASSNAAGGQFGRSASPQTRLFARGFTLLELIVVVAIVVVITAIAIPQVQSGMAFYRFRSQLQQVTGAIQRTRFQALAQGVPYRLSFDAAAGTYQVSHPSDFTNKPTVFDAADPAIPFTGAGLSLAANITYEFRPSGSVLVTPANASASVTDGKRVSTVNVSPRGSVTVTEVH